jgi:putative effector of murein hydrolase
MTTLHGLAPVTTLVGGFALGAAAHGIGAAQVMQVNADTDTYAGLGLQVILASLLMPLMISLAGRYSI